MESYQEKRRNASATGTIKMLAVIWKWRKWVLIALITAALFIAGYLIMTSPARVVSLTMHTGTIQPEKDQPLVAPRKLESKLRMGNMNFSFPGYCSGKLRQCDLLKQMEMAVNEEQHTLRLNLPADRVSKPVAVLDSLFQTLKDYYQPEVSYHRQNIDRTILLRNKELKDIQIKIEKKRHMLNLENGQQEEKIEKLNKEYHNKQSRINVLQDQIKTQQLRIKEIKKEIEELSSSNQSLMDERKNFVDQANDKNLSYFSLLSNTIQQNFRHISNLRTSVFNLKYQINQEKGDIDQLKNDMDYLESRMEYLQEDAGKNVKLLHSEIEKLKTQKASLKTKLNILGYRAGRIENISVVAGPSFQKGYSIPALIWKGIKILFVTIVILITLLFLYEYIVRNHQVIQRYAS